MSKPIDLAAHIGALADGLTTASQTAWEAHAAAARGHQNEAIGTLLPVMEQLETFTALCRRSSPCTASGKAVRMSTLREEYGLACPRCGSDDRLFLVIEVRANLTPYGTDITDDAHHWDHTSPCQCEQCGHAGAVAGFTVEGEP